MNILQENWDNLIILDDCRYDSFKKINFIPGKLKKIKSPGGHTFMWFCGTFKEIHYNNIVYYSQNPWVSKTRLKKPSLKYETTFEQLYSVKRNKTPEEFNEFVFNSINAHDNKRFIFHYILPHTPFLKGPSDMVGKGNGQIAQEVIKGEVKKEKYIKTYEQNIEYVLDKAMDLMAVLEGKTVITSDHGELFGEHHLWGHGTHTVDTKGKVTIVGFPNMIMHPKLREVPWLEVESPEEQNKRELAQLGYIS